MEECIHTSHLPILEKALASGFVVQEKLSHLKFTLEYYLLRCKINVKGLLLLGIHLYLCN